MPVLESPLTLARLAVVVCGLACLADAAGFGVVSVNQPWLTPGVRSSEAYMVLASSEGGTLIGARSALASRVEILSPSGRVEALALPAGTPVVLRPTGNRLALYGLNHPLKLGARVPLTLLIETGAGMRQEIGVDAEVRVQSPADAELRAHRH